MLRSPLPRLLLAAAVTLTGLAVAGGPASAESADIAYTCDWYHGLDIGPRGTADSTGRFDTAIPEGGVVQVGDPIDIDPANGTFVLPEPFVDALRAAGRTEFVGYASVDAPWDLPGTRRHVGFDVPAVPLPASGPMTIQLVGARNIPRSLDQPGTYTLVAGQFGLVSDDDFSGMVCRLQPDVPSADRAIDTITVVDATAAPTTTTEGPSATTSPSSTSPVRPALVQTDQPQSGGTVAPFVALGVVAVLVAGGAAAVWARRPRRH